MSNIDDFQKYLKNFLKRPILVEQEAQIITAIIDGRLNMQSAKKLYKLVIEQNLKAHEKIMVMTHEEIRSMYHEIYNNSRKDW